LPHAFAPIPIPFPFPLQVLRPLIRDSDHATNPPQALTLAVAFGCNIGGMPTPIASPQNATAMVSLEAVCSSKAAAPTTCELGFAEWMGVGVPVGVVMLLVSYVAIVVAYMPSVARVPVFDSGARVFFMCSCKLFFHWAMVAVGAVGGGSKGGKVTCECVHLMRTRARAPVFVKRDNLHSRIQSRD
jgi:hypothetical protein